MITDSTLPEDEKPETAEASVPDVSLNDKQTDEAVEDIEQHEADGALADGDGTKFRPPARPWYRKFFEKKKLWIPAVIILVLIVLGAVPFSRYKLLGLVWKQTYKISVLDSQTRLPVSDAVVAIDGHSTMTNNAGDADIKAPVGSQKLTISKKYYATLSSNVLVGLRIKGARVFSLQATGRQVPLKVVSLVGGAPLTNIEVAAAGTSAKTNKNGQVTIVLPADKTSVTASLSGSGYNQRTATITITAKATDANTFQLTPSGRVYFLSNASGKIDVVSTNLDGSDRQTVLAGTGNEDPQNTTLLQSADWKYVALQAKRNTSQTGNALYLIDTATGNLMTMDAGNANFIPIGWSDHYFIYEVTRNDVLNYQNGQEALKSYDADTGKITVLDQSSATGNSTDWADTQFSSFYIFGDELFYASGWTGDTTLAQGQTDALKTVHADGQDKVVLKTFDATQTSGYFQTALFGPQSLYILVTTYPSGGYQNTFYEYSGGSVKQAPASVSQSTFDQLYSTYALSPSGNSLLTAQLRDGQLVLMVGASDGTNQATVASLSSDYSFYGWYTDNYLLVSYKGSQLYIIPANGLKSGQQPVKITDYFQSAYGGR